MSQPLYQLVHMEARPGQEDALLALLHTVIAGTHQEPGHLQYDLWHSLDEPATFVMVERWPNQAAVEAHRQQQHLHDFLRDAPALLVRPLEIKRYMLNN